MAGQIYLGRRLRNVYVWETLPSVTHTELNELSHSCSDFSVIPVGELTLVSIPNASGSSPVSDSNMTDISWNHSN